MGLRGDEGDDSVATDLESETEHIESAMADVAHLASLRADPDDAFTPSGASADEVKDDWEELSRVSRAESDLAASSDSSSGVEPVVTPTVTPLTLTPRTPTPGAAVDSEPLLMLTGPKALAF
eukprot:783805-Rhodomonas_salina.1